MCREKSVPPPPELSPAAASVATMAKAAKTTFRCAECGWSTLKWVGRCGECQAWGTVEEAGAPAAGFVAAAPVTSRARPITEISVESAEAVPTGVGELDRVLGGGAVPGGVVLLAGVYLATDAELWDEAWVGISFLLLFVIAGLGATLLRKGEEALAATAEAGDEPGYASALGIVRRWTLITLALIVFVIFLMTTKPF